MQYLNATFHAVFSERRHGRMVETLEKNEIDLLFSSVFFTILQVFIPEIAVIQDQVLINVGEYGPRIFILK